MCPFSTSAEKTANFCRENPQLLQWTLQITRVNFGNFTREIYRQKIRALQNGAERLPEMKDFVKNFVELGEMSWLRCTFFATFFSFGNVVLRLWLLNIGRTAEWCRTTSWPSSGNTLTRVERNVTKVRTKRLKTAKWGADFGKESCLGGLFGLLNTQNGPKMFVKFAPTSLKIAQNNPKSS